MDEHQSCECFYALLPEYWGRGLATEAIKRLIDYGFQRLNIKQIVARISQNNPRSLRIANKLGMREQGLVEFQSVPEATILFVLTPESYYTTALS